MQDRKMKTYAKSLPGSLYVVDKRHQLPTLETASAQEADMLTEFLPKLGSADVET